MNYLISMQMECFTKSCYTKYYRQIWFYGKLHEISMKLSYQDVFSVAFNDYLISLINVSLYICRKHRQVRLLLSVVIFFLVLRDQWLQYIKYWELSTAQASSRGRERCCTFHYLSWTDSIKTGLQFSFFTLVWSLSMDRLFTRINSLHGFISFIFHIVWSYVSTYLYAYIFRIFEWKKWCFDS